MRYSSRNKLDHNQIAAQLMAQRQSSRPTAEELSNITAGPRVFVRENRIPQGAHRRSTVAPKFLFWILLALLMFGCLAVRLIQIG